MTPRCRRNSRSSPRIHPGLSMSPSTPELGSVTPPSLGDPAKAVTSFFLPGLLPGVEPDRAYAALRADAEQRIGRGIRATRIYALSARREGTDSETRVGEADPCTGATVRAIFATYVGYTVISDCGNVDLTTRQVYEAVPFD